MRSQTERYSLEGVDNLEKGLDDLDVPVTVVTAALDEIRNRFGSGAARPWRGRTR